MLDHQHNISKFCRILHRNSKYWRVIHRNSIFYRIMHTNQKSCRILCTQDFRIMDSALDLQILYGSHIRSCAGYMKFWELNYAYTVQLNWHVLYRSQIYYFSYTLLFKCIHSLVNDRLACAFVWLDTCRYYGFQNCAWTYS